MQVAAAELVWPYKLLTEAAHSRLVANIDEIAAMAGIPVDELDRTMKQVGCSSSEIAWVKDYPKLCDRTKKGGLILSGAFDPPAGNRMMAITAAFLRNYVDARYVTLDRLVPKESIQAEDIPSPTVLVIPDFCHGNPLKPGHMLPHWQAQKIYGLVMERFAQRRATLIHVDDLSLIEKEYGKSFLDFLQANWDVIATK